MRVFVTGGTGLVGGRLVKKLLGRGDQVVLLTRQPADQVRGRFPGVEVVCGDPVKSGPWQDTAADCDGVVHLAGENLFARRWNADVKKLLVASRVEGTRNVVTALSRKPSGADGRRKVLVSASAIGIYGPTGNEELDENSPAGADFLATLCAAWEKEAHAAEADRRPHGDRAYRGCAGPGRRRRWRRCCCRSSWASAARSAAAGNT